MLHEKKMGIPDQNMMNTSEYRSLLRIKRFLIHYLIKISKDCTMLTPHIKS